MAQTLQAAFVLHGRPFSDSSLLIEVLTPEHGRQPLLAKGARSGRTRFPRLQPFAPLWLAWRGRGEIRSLTQADSRGIAFALAGERLYCGMYLNELLTRMTPRGEACERLFGLYENSLSALAAGAALEPLLRGFELEMLEDLGYGMLLTHTEEGLAVTADDWYEYEPARGPCGAARPSSQAVSGSTLLAMACRDFSDADVRRQARRLMRRVLDHHLDHRALKSRELFTRPR